MNAEHTSDPKQLRRLRFDNYVLRRSKLASVTNAATNAAALLHAREHPAVSWSVHPLSTIHHSPSTASFSYFPLLHSTHVLRMYHVPANP